MAKKQLPGRYAFALILAFLLAAQGRSAPAQTTNQPGNSHPLYQQVRSISTRPFSECASLSNLQIKRDAATFSIQSGEIYFFEKVQGRNIAAVFIGRGDFSIVPPTQSEKKALSIFSESPDFKEGFSQMVMHFSDQAYDEIRKSGNANFSAACSQQAKAASVFKEKEETLRKDRDFRTNISLRLLEDLLAPEKPGFFSTFIQGDKYGKLFFMFDPFGIPAVYPENVMLYNFSENNWGVWTAFYKEEEYKSGRAIGSPARRLYDMAHHNIDAKIEGTRITAKDEITIKMLEPGLRVLQLDLFDYLRVNSVKNEQNEALDFVQEKKNEDSSLGIILPTAPEPGKPFKVKIEYDGPEALEGAGGGNFYLGPRSTWYPNNPSTSFGDRAVFDLKFSFPKRFDLIAIGNKVEEKVEGDQKVAKWSSEGMEMVVAGFNYGEFKVKEVLDETTGLKLEVYANRFLPNEIRALENADIGTISTTGGMNGVLDDAQNATRLYSLFFGKMPYKRVAMSQQPEGFFGQAWGTLVYMPYWAYISETHRVQIFGARMGTGNFWTEVAAHEVAHQWWGHAVGWKSYRDQWMSEGFSEFSTSLFLQYSRQNMTKFGDFWDSTRRQIVLPSPATKGKKPYTLGPVTQGSRLTNGRNGDAYQMVYPKGAYILHMIRMMMYDHRGKGDAAFQVMMKDFIKTHYNQDVSTDDFKKAVEKHMTPAMDVDKNKTMDWFFDSYVYGTDIPSYKFNYTIGTDASGKPVINGKITQSGVSKDFVMLVPIYLDAGKGWINLGSATIVGNESLELKDVPVPQGTKKANICVFKDVLAENIEVSK